LTYFFHKKGVVICKININNNINNNGVKTCLAAYLIASIFLCFQMGLSFYRLNFKGVIFSAQFAQAGLIA